MRWTACHGGSTSISDLSAHLEEAVERAWVYGSLLFGESQIRTGHLIVGVVKTRSLYNHLLSISGEFSKVKYDALTDNFQEIVWESTEQNLTASDGFQSSPGAPGEASGAMAPAQMGKNEALQEVHRRSHRGGCRWLHGPHCRA